MKPEYISTFHKIWGWVWVPPTMLQDTEPCLLHLSDTPASTFKALKKLIDDLQPRWIVHTGDLVDDIKLGLHPRKRRHYTEMVSGLVQILESSSAINVTLCMGNHDDLKIIEQLAKRAALVENAGSFMVEGRVFSCAHYAEDALNLPHDFALFGHDLRQRTGIGVKGSQLNGIEGIHVVYPRSGRVVTLPYPMGTNSKRLLQTKIGL